MQKIEADRFAIESGLLSRPVAGSLQIASAMIGLELSEPGTLSLDHWTQLGSPAQSIQTRAVCSRCLAAATWGSAPRAGGTRHPVAKLAVEGASIDDELLDEVEAVHSVRPARRHVLDDLIRVDVRPWVDVRPLMETV